MAETVLTPPEPWQIRAELEELVIGDVYGPVDGDEHEEFPTSERPTDRYVLGRLAPSGATIEPEEHDSLGDSGATEAVSETGGSDTDGPDEVDPDTARPEWEALIDPRDIELPDFTTRRVQVPPWDRAPVRSASSRLPADDRARGLRAENRCDAGACQGAPASNTEALAVHRTKGSGLCSGRERSGGAHLCNILRSPAAKTPLPSAVKTTESTVPSCPLRAVRLPRCPQAEVHTCASRELASILES